MYTTSKLFVIIFGIALLVGCSCNYSSIDSYSDTEDNGLNKSDEVPNTLNSDKDSLESEQHEMGD